MKGRVLFTEYLSPYVNVRLIASAATITQAFLINLSSSLISPTIPIVKGSPKITSLFVLETKLKKLSPRVEGELIARRI